MAWGEGTERPGGSLGGREGLHHRSPQNLHKHHWMKTDRVRVGKVGDPHSVPPISNSPSTTTGVALDSDPDAEVQDGFPTSQHFQAQALGKELRGHLRKERLGI